MIIKLRDYQQNKFTKEYKHQVYRRACDRMVDKLNENNGKSFVRTDIIKLIHLCVKVIRTIPNGYTKEDLYYYKSKIDFVNDILPYLTIGELKLYFPINKTYDGEKWECKDYFYTIDSLKKYDDTDTIDDVFNILWEYMNTDLMKFQCNSLSILSDINRLNGKQGLAEMFAQEFKIPYYTKTKDGSYKEVWQKPKLSLIK